ncbi:MAG TPA: hypothetical protein VFD32_03065 [Dehalococcoidia bacterium]|nr:hypothetical protein [Dehalococcoidia bacterium]
MERLYFNRLRKRIIPRRAANLSLFSNEELAIVDGVLEALRFFTAQDVSALSHMELGWRIAAYREAIPYETVFLSNQGPTAADITRGQELARELGSVGTI